MMVYIYTIFKLNLGFEISNMAANLFEAYGWLDY